MFNSTKIAMFILVVVVILGEMGKEEGADYPKFVSPPPPSNKSPGLPSLPPLPEKIAEGEGVLPPSSNRDPIIEIEDEAKSSRSQYTGTAFSIDDRGLWVTARHVIHGCDQLMLLRPHSRPLGVDAVSEHSRADVALLRTDGGYDAFPIDGTTPEYNQEGFHFGFPGGEPGDVYSRLVGRRTIKTTGTRNGKEPVLVWAEKIRVPNSNESLGGISGGPILNKDGSIVGVHIAGSVRRGRSFSSLPRTIDQLLNQNDIKLENQSLSQDISRLNQKDFARLGNEFRSQNRVAQVICRTR
ncbi:MAG: serine protease [Emcibacteraceae bacterium]|nr:serine protease [Emcibacteraceae bacterium]